MRETLREFLRANGYDVGKIAIEPSEATYAEVMRGS